MTRHRVYHIDVVRKGHPSYLCPLSSPSDAAEFFQRRIGRSAYERVMALFLDDDCIPLGYREISRGSHSAAVVTPRDIFVAAFKLGATAVIIAHNHPSNGTPEASSSITSSLRIGVSFLSERKRPP